MAFGKPGIGGLYKRVWNSGSYEEGLKALQDANLTKDDLGRFAYFADSPKAISSKTSNSKKEQLTVERILHDKSISEKGGLNLAERIDRGGKRDKNYLTNEITNINNQLNSKKYSENDKAKLRQRKTELEHALKPKKK